MHGHFYFTGNLAHAQSVCTFPGGRGLGTRLILGHTIDSTSSPGPYGTHRLRNPASGYIVYFRKILCKLIIYDYVIFLFLFARTTNKCTMRTRSVRSGDWQVKDKKETYQASCLNWRSKCHAVGYSARTLLRKFYW